MKHTDCFYLYAWLNKNPYTVNMGKKVSKKGTYVSSLSSMKFWNDFGGNKLEQYCIFESLDEAVVGAAEWWGLDYGIKVLGKDKFYNKVNNAHKGDQSLVSIEIKNKIVDFYNGKLNPETDRYKFNVGKNIIDRVENGYYPVIQHPVYKLIELQRNQARAIEQNVVLEQEIVTAYNTDPKQVLRDVTPVTLIRRKDGTLEVVNGHTRIGAASKCRGWNEMPVCIVDESEFGDTELDIASNVLVAGSYANRRSPIITAENSDDDLQFQMQNYLALHKIDIKHKTAREYIRDLLTGVFSESAGSKSKASGAVTSLYKQFDKEQNELSISKNMKVYSDSELKNYCFQKYESKGISTIHSTMTSMKFLAPIAFTLNHAHANSLPDQLAIVLHCRSKDEYVTAQSSNRVADMQQVIDHYKLPIIIDVLPSFDK